MCLFSFKNSINENKSICSIFSIWKAQVIMDKKGATKCIVPQPWVDNVNDVVYWPPKGKPVQYYINKWVFPTKDWKSYNRIEVLLEGGTRDEAEQMINFSTTEEEPNNEIHGM